MRVLHIIDSLQPGGAERSLAATAPELIKRGLDLHVAYLHERDGVGPELRRAGATLHDLSGNPGRLAWQRAGRKLVRDVAPHIVHTSLFESHQVGRVAARLNAVPVVSSLVGIQYGPEHLNNPQIRRLRLRTAQAADIATARLVRRFHAVSEHVATTMAKRLMLNRGRIDVIHRGRDPAALGERTEQRATAARSELGLEEAELLLAVARHEHVKGLDRLIMAMPEVCSLLPTVKLLIAGSEGGATESLRRLVEDVGLDSRVHFLGARQDVSELMCAASALVLPSRSEGLPGTLIEAMLLELPIVADDLPAVHEVLGPSPPAQIVRADDCEALGGAIVRMIQTPPDVAPLRSRALEKFSIESVADHTVTFYRRSV